MKNKATNKGGKMEKVVKMKRQAPQCGDGWVIIDSLDYFRMQIFVESFFGLLGY